MAMLTLEERVAMLEKQVNGLIAEKVEERDGVNGSTHPTWLERWYGAFQDSPNYDAAMQLGANYRRSQPNPADDFDAITFDDEESTA